MSRRAARAPQPDPELAESPANGLKVRLMLIDAIRPDPANVREHGPRNLDAIRDSLKAFGQQKPLVIDADGVIVAGSGTWQAARDLGWEKIACVVTKLEGQMKTAFAVADNRIGELSFFDETKLLEQLTPLREAGLAIGFDEAELAELAGMLNRPAQFAGDGAERAPSAKSGDRQITVRATISVQSAELLERALSATGLINREDALLAVCKVYLDKYQKGEGR